MIPSRLLICVTVIAVSVAAIGRHESAVFPHARMLDGNTKPDQTPASINIMDRYEEYLAYLKKFDKKYDTVDEMNKHFKIYCENLKKIEEHNKTNSSYKQGINKFTDISDEEFESGYVMHIDMRKMNKIKPDKKPEGEAK